MNPVRAVALLSWMQLGLGCAFIVFIFFQVFSKNRFASLLRLASWTVLILLVVSVAFGRYYSSGLTRKLADLTKQNPSEAAYGYSAAIRLRPTDSNLYAQRGIAYFALGHYSRAAADFMRAGSYSADSPKYYADRGFAELAQRNYQMAEAAFNKANSFGFRTPLTELGRAVISEARGQDDAAKREYTMAINAGLDMRNRCFAIFHRGLAYSRLKQYDRAVPDFAEAAQSCIDLREDALVNLGTAQSALGDNERAIANWNRALTLEPNDPVIFKNRAILYLEAGQPSAAVVDLDKYVSLRPNDPYGYSLRAEAHQNQGSNALADADLRTAKRLAGLKESPMGIPTMELALADQVIDPFNVS